MSAQKSTNQKPSSERSSFEEEAADSMIEQDVPILRWYDRKRPIQVDLIGEFAGKELFLLEGDSLLRHCFEDERIDFAGGFQLLHAVYVVERFLNNLIKRSCHFHIAFFEENAELCVPPQVSANLRLRYLLARSIILNHLTLHSSLKDSAIAVNRFTSIKSDEFIEYLQNSSIYFVMVHDASTSTDESELPFRADKKVFRGILRWFLHHGRNAALINQVNFGDSKVFTTIVTSAGTEDTSFSWFAGEFEPNIKALLSFYEEHNQSLNIPTSYSNIDQLQEVVGKERLGGFSHLALLALMNLSNGPFADNFLLSAFAFHLLLLDQLSLSQRSFPLINFSPEIENRISTFLNAFAHVSQTLLSDPDLQSETLLREKRNIDLLDGRLFRCIIQVCAQQDILGNIPETLQNQWASLCRITNQLTSFDIVLQNDEVVKQANGTSTSGSHLKQLEDLALLPISNSTFDKHLSSIVVRTESSPSASFSTLRKTTYWRKFKRPVIVKSAEPEKISKWRNPLRLNQFYMREMTIYASSLVGAQGKALTPETITVGPRQPSKMITNVDLTASKSKPGAKVESKATSTAKPKKGTKKASTTLSKKDQIIADNKEKKEGAESDRAFSSWAMIIKNLEALSDLKERYARAKIYLEGLDSAKLVFLEGEIYTYMIQCLANLWAGYCTKGKKSDGYFIVALLWSTVRSLSILQHSITVEIVKHVTKVCTAISITDSLASLEHSGSEGKLSFNFKFPKTGTNLEIGMTQMQFQLNYCGPYMDRMLDAKPDYRVNGFTPDGWQRSVLDELDANRSVFVVAPTSAGKTFISFYAMEQILRADDEGVLVYVAPTKALVNQIAAEVQGRFSKKYSQPGKNIWCIHASEYKINNPTKCQILITVPHVLQIMLLSPSNAKIWAPKVRRIIFDEVHSISQASDGIVWEQLLLLAPCPIIALSATVGNPEKFNDWLSVTQEASGFDMKMIQHSTRYSDLRKYMYIPPTTFDFHGLGDSRDVGLGLDISSGFHAIHPVSCLIDKSRGIPDDLSLEPQDCLTLWSAMRKHSTKEYAVSDTLDPTRFLPTCIRKADVFKWERALKDILQMWILDPSSPFDSVVEELSQSGKLKSSTSENSQESVDESTLESTTLPLLKALHERKALPAILFNYNRSECESVGRHVLSQLLRAEDSYKSGPEWKSFMMKYEEYQELKAKKSKTAPKITKGKSQDDNGGSKLERMRDEAPEGSSIYDLIDPTAPLPEFTFADVKKLSKEELDGWTKQLMRKFINPDLIEMLKRGIGIHHSGMNRRYRQCVEILFRKGFLRVIIATGTLSLGINMPCSTVVFNGDSFFLTAQNFRQASGRSGRRGFDLLGNVVFQNIPSKRASQLLSSSLPDITGHFPITTTLVLRLFSLLNNSNNSQYAVKVINSLLSQDKLYLGGSSVKEQILYHFRFSIEYLRRNCLLGPGGEPVNFAGITSHLYYTENSSFLFQALLRGRYFHKLCADIELNQDKVLHTMVLVLSHLFGRQSCRVLDDSETIKERDESISTVYLPEMPKDAEKILRSHNDMTLGIFSTYVKTFTEQFISEEERYLPLTRTQIGTDSSNAMRLNFLPSSPNPRARSAFVALSGLGDDFRSIDDLYSSSKEGVYLESSVIPHIEIYPDEMKSPLNAYILDFFTHGSLDALETGNGIDKSRIWFMLNDFSQVLATIKTSLSQYLNLAIDTDPDMLDVLGGGDEGEILEDEKVAAEQITAPIIAPQEQTPQLVNRSKRKVVDDWDASEDALASEELLADNTDGYELDDTEEYEQLKNIYRAFAKLNTEFDAKFKSTWA